MTSGFLLVCLLFLPLAARGADIRDYTSLQMAFYDDPDALLKWMKVHYGEVTPEREPEHWVRATVMFLNVLDTIDDIPGGLDTVRKARALAETHRMFAEGMILDGSIELYASDSPVDAPEVQAETDRRYRLNIEKARQLKLSRLQALYMVSYAGFLFDHGEVNQSLMLLVESAKVVEEDQKSSVFDKVEFKIHMAAAFMRHGQSERALSFFLDIDRICQKTELKLLCSRNYNDLARTYWHLGTADDLAKAEGYVQRSLALGATMLDQAQATSYYLLTEIALARQDYPKAVRAVQKFLTQIENHEDSAAMREGLMLAARALHGADQNHEAAAYLSKAEKLPPPDDMRDVAAFYQTAHAIHRALGRTTEALTDLEKYVEAHQQLDAKADKDTYQKLMVQMGLSVEEQRVKILSQENELQNQKIRETERFRAVALVFLVLLVLIIALMVQSILKSREMRQRRVKMQRILDHIDEGILTINSHLQIDSEYSRHLHALLDDASDLRQRPVLDVLLKQTTLSNESRSILHETLTACLNEDAIAWDLNEAQLPTELQMGGRAIALHWQPIVDEHRVIRDVILSLRDVSGRKILEAQVAAAQQKTEILTQRVSELVNADIDRCAGLLDELESLLDQWQGSIKPRLHTAKGLARALGLRALSQLIHDTEDTLVREPLAQMTAEYRHVIQNIFRKSESRTLNLAGIMSELQPRLMEHLAQHQVALQSLAIDDQWLHWSAQDSRDLEFVLIHALTNALDHGFIRPQSRGVAIGSVCLHVEATRESHGMQVIVRDNGVGIDWERLRAIALEKNFAVESGQPISDVLFVEGVSTAESTSMTSGRGVGLTAIRSISQERNGEVHILDNDRGRGTMLIVQWPEALKKAG